MDYKNELEKTRLAMEKRMAELSTIPVQYNVVLPVTDEQLKRIVKALEVQQFTER